MTWIWVVVPLFAILLALVLFVLPRLLVHGELEPEGIERRRLQNDIVRTAIEVLGGVFFLATAAFTLREIQIGQDQLEVAREGQITERFTRAVDQLGSDKLDVRVGGIYALERIARDSPRDRGPTMEILAAFVRQRSPISDRIVNVREVRGARPPSDIQAAATVIGRINQSPESTRSCNPRGGPNFPCVANLERVDLSGIDLSGGNFGSINFNGARLAGGNYGFASFHNANLAFSDLRLANFRLADVTGVAMHFSELESTNFHLTKGLTCDQLKSTRSGPDGAANLTIDCPA